MLIFMNSKDNTMNSFHPSIFLIIYAPQGYGELEMISAVILWEASVPWTVG